MEDEGIKTEDKGIKPEDKKFKTPSEMIKCINSDYSVAQADLHLARAAQELQESYTEKACGSQTPVRNEHRDHSHLVVKGHSSLHPGHAALGGSSRAHMLTTTGGHKKSQSQSPSVCACHSRLGHPSSIGHGTGHGTGMMKTEDIAEDVPKKDEEKPSVWGFVQWDPFVLKDHAKNAKGTTRNSVDLRSDVRVVRFTADGRHIAAGLGNGDIVLIDAVTGKQSYILQYPKPTKPMGVTAILSLPHCRKPDDYHKLTATYAGGWIRHWFYTNVHDKKMLWEINDMRRCGGTLGADINPYRNHQLLTCGGDTMIKLYDTDKKEMIAYFGNDDRNDHNSAAHTDRVFTVKYNTTVEHQFISGGWDGKVFLWDARHPPNALRFIQDRFICADGIDMQDNKVLTAQHRKEKSVQIHEWRSGYSGYEFELIKYTNRKRDKSLSHETMPFTGMFFRKENPKNKNDSLILIGGHSENMVALYRSEEKTGVLRSQGELHNLPFAVDSVHYHNNSVALGCGTCVWKCNIKEDI